MKTSNHWNLLRSGKVEIGLKDLQDAYATEPNPSRIMELGVAYLFVEQYVSAWTHFSRAIESYPRSMSGFYGMAGTAKWCLGEFNEAVRYWKDGLKVRYADTAGLGIQMPLLLYTASVLQPSTFEREAAEKILVKKTEDSRIKTWHGPLASWLLGQTSENNLQDYCRNPDTRHRTWLIEFYGGILRYNRRDHSGFIGKLRKLVDTSHPEWSDKMFFLRRMWNEEFFIARYEVERSNRKQ